MYSSEYTSGFSEPAASHLAVPPSPRHERQCRTGPSPALFMKVRCKSVQTRSETGTRRREALGRNRPISWLGIPLAGLGKTISAQQNFDGPHVCLRDQSSSSTGKHFRRVLKKAAFSPAQPRRAETRRSAGKAAREVLLLQRFTHLQNEAGELFQHPAWLCF